MRISDWSSDVCSSDLAKSPMIEDDGRIIIESGAIAEHIIERYGNGRLAPAPGTQAHERYRQWLYFAVSSGMNPIMIKVYARAFGLGGDPIDHAADGQLAQVLSFVDDVLSPAPYLVDDSFSAADIPVRFIPEKERTSTRLTARH